MLKKVLICAALAAVAAAPAQAQSRVLLMPGVTYERQVQFTSHGPVAVHVLNAPRPGGSYALKPVLSNGAILGKDRVTAMQRGVRDATAAGVNGDLFTWTDGRPSGMLMQDGVLHHPPLAERSTLGIAGDGALRVQKLRMFGTWRGTGQRRPMDLNEAPGPNGISLFTPAWGPATPVVAGAVEAILSPLPATTPNVDLSGPVVGQAQNGNTPIPPGGAVLVARGTAAQRLLAEAPVGTTVTVRLLVNPDVAGVAHAIGGGPALVRDGKPDLPRQRAVLDRRRWRATRGRASGQLADGRIVMVVVDGRQPGYSVGMTNFELAQTLVRLGAVTGAGLDAGGSSTMAFDGALLNRPSDPGGERAVSEGLFVLYTGVVAAPPGGAGPLAERRRRRRRPAALVQARPPVDRHRQPDRPRPGGARGRPGAKARRRPALLVGRDERRRHARRRGPVAPLRDGDRRGRADDGRRPLLLAQPHARRALGRRPRFVRIGRGGTAQRSFTLTRPARVTGTLRDAQRRRHGDVRPRRPGRAGPP